MLESIELGNFKAFRNSGKVDLQKINIFVGPNSSGKSSFIKALLTLRNTINSNDNEMVLDLNESIGNFNSVIFNNDIRNRIKIKLYFKERNLVKNNTKIRITETILKIMNSDINPSQAMDLATYSFMGDNEKNKFDKVKFVEFYIKTTKGGGVIIDEFNINYNDSDIISIKKDRNSYYMYYNRLLIPEANIVKPYKFFFKVNQLKITNKLEKSDLEKIILFEYTMEHIEKQLIEFAKNVSHIDPVRNQVKRVEYVTNLKFNNTVGHMGENTITTLVGLEKNIKDDSNISIIKDSINKWLNEFDLGENISIKRLGNDNYSLYIKNKNTGLNCNILDMGVGTSQLLPIIIESINSPENAILIIEEPESHIHPNAQSKLADLFVDIVKEQNKRFIIETHSMFLIVKLQILIAQGVIKSDDVCIYYFNQTENGTETKRMEISENGQFKEAWPSGFFDVQLQLGKMLFNEL